MSWGKIKVKLLKGDNYNMKKRILPIDFILKFKEHLILEERSVATVEKYIRDVKSFADYVGENEITKFQK